MLLNIVLAGVIGYCAVAFIISVADWNESRKKLNASRQKLREIQRRRQVPQPQ